MPVMPRMNKKAKKIAYKILGTPANIRHKPTPQEVYVNRRLLYEETYRVR